MGVTPEEEAEYLAVVAWNRLDEMGEKRSFRSGIRQLALLEILRPILNGMGAFIGWVLLLLLLGGLGWLPEVTIIIGDSAEALSIEGTPGLE